MVDTAEFPEAPNLAETITSALPTLVILVHLDLRRAAIDKQFCPGNEAAVVRRQEHCRLRDFIGRAEPAQRDAGE